MNAVYVGQTTPAWNQAYYQSLLSVDPAGAAAYKKSVESGLSDKEESSSFDLGGVLQGALGLFGIYSAKRAAQQGAKEAEKQMLIAQQFQEARQRQQIEMLKAYAPMAGIIVGSVTILGIIAIIAFRRKK